MRETRLDQPRRLNRETEVVYTYFGAYCEPLDSAHGRAVYHRGGRASEENYGHEEEPD